MPATPSQLRRPIVVRHTVDFGDGVTVEFVFDRNKLTDAWMNEWMRLEDERDAPQLNAMLDDLISGWDVLNDDGSPYPKSVETIGFLFALPDKAQIFQELLEAAIPTRAEGNVSSGQPASPSTDSMQLAESSPNGPGTSPLPAPSASPSLT